MHLSIFSPKEEWGGHARGGGFDIFLKMKFKFLIPGQNNIIIGQNPQPGGRREGAQMSFKP